MALAKDDGSDDGVFTTFVRQNASRALRFAYATLAQREDAEDVTQEAFLRLWRHVERHGAHTLSRALLHRTLTNLCRDQLRYRRRHPAVPLVPADGPAWPSVAPDAETVLQLERAVSDLSPGEQQAVLLYYYLDYSVDVTAAILYVRRDAVKTRLHRARQRLRVLLDEAPAVRDGHGKAPALAAGS
jgi:RNA polymerase sigma-70 factor (ECF subfamily)